MKPRLITSILLPAVICSVGISIYGLAQESAIVTGDKATGDAKPATKTATADLASVPLVESLVARRAAALEAAEKALDAELEQLLAERGRESKELRDWLAKERDKLAPASIPMPAGRRKGL